MSRLKKILWALLILFAAIQFIQPVRNKSGQASPIDMVTIYRVPDSVQTIFRSACYDCHSNYTRYPWYSNVEPAGWLLARHIKHGKKDLNFSEFGSYSVRQQQSKLKSIASQINDGEMPLSSYKLIHKKARLSKEEKTSIIAWAQKVKDSLDKKQ